MIRLFTGVPRSGKSYLAVYEILELLSTDKKIHILTNIEGLTVDDARLTVTEFQPLFFQNTQIAPYLRDLRDKHGLDASDKIHIYIDEAQRYFKKPDPDTVYFFDYHGHYGCDVTIITQHEKKIAFDIACHHEEEYRAAASSTNPFASFFYKKMQAGEQFGTKKLKREKRVFDAYKSFQAGDGRTAKSNLRWYVLGGCLFAVVMWLLFFRVFAASFGLTGDDPVVPPPAPAPAPSGPVVPPPAPSAPAPVVQPLGPSRLGDDEVALSLYVGPEIMDYSLTQDAVQIAVGDNALPAWVLVSDFVSIYHPQVFGYGYFHAPGRRFVMFSADNGELIYPKRNPIYVRNSEPVSVAASQIVLEHPYGQNPDMPDSRGWTSRDRLQARYFALRDAGFNVLDPSKPVESTQAAEIPDFNNSTMP